MQTASCIRKYITDNSLVSYVLHTYVSSQCQVPRTQPQVKWFDVRRNLYLSTNTPTLPHLFSPHEYLTEWLGFLTSVYCCTFGHAQLGMPSSMRSFQKRLYHLSSFELNCRLRGHLFHLKPMESGNEISALLRLIVVYMLEGDFPGKIP